MWLPEKHSNYTIFAGKKSISRSMSKHIIPEDEDDEHIESPDCPCEPNFILDEESGEMIWRHIIQDKHKFIDNIFGF